MAGRPTFPSFVHKSKVNRFTLRPFTTVPLPDGKSVEVKDGQLPGIEILGGSVKLDTKSEAVSVLVIQPEEGYPSYDGDRIAIWGLPEDDITAFWNEINTLAIRKHGPRFVRDQFLDVAETCNTVLESINRGRSQIVQPVDDQGQTSYSVPTRRKVFGGETRDD